jgi:hypothetical protein
MPTIRLDWNHDGTFSHPAADITAFVRRATWTLGYPDPVRSADRLPPDASAVIELDNADGRFSPDNASGPHHNALLPGRRVQMLLDDVPLWTGWLQHVDVSPGEHGPRTATLHAAGGFFLLQDHHPRLAPQQNQRADALLRDLLAQVPASPALQTGWRVQLGQLGSTTTLYATSDQLLDSVGQTLFAYIGDVWGDATSALRVIEQLVQAERGWFWQGRDGRFVFRGRHFYLTDTTSPPAVDLGAVATAATYAHGEDITTTVRITCYPRSVTPDVQPLWQSRTPLRVGPLRDRTFIVHLDGAVSGALTLETALPYTDYTATDDFNRDRTGAIALSAVLDGGSLARVNVRNPLPVAVDVDVQLRGVGVTLFDAVTVEAADVDALLTYGRHLLDLRIPLLDDPDTAQNLADWLLQQRATPSGALHHFTVRDHDAASSTHLKTWTLGTRLDIAEAQTHAAGRYLLTGETGQWTPDDGLALAYTLTPLDTTPYAVLDVQGPLGVGVVGY